LADEDLHIVEANDQAVQTYGYSKEELLDLRLPDMLPPEGLLAFEVRLADAEDRASSTHEATHRRRDGSVFPVEVSDRMIRLEGKDYYQAIVRDISERKRVEESLRESEERYRSLAAENERLYQQQLNIAENLQLALLHVPSELGGVRLGHLYRSATETAKVGGDFYDVFEVRDGRIAVLIGDVAGHGIEAARAAALTKDVIHAFAHQTLRPHEALRRTNKLLLEKPLPGFVTVFLGILDPQRQTLCYASAGHPEMLLRRKDGEIELLGMGSPPLGVFPEASWKTSEVHLGAADLLLLYTDGIIEARRDGELFGERRLQALLKRRVSVERLPQVIVDEVLDFSGGALQDDVAVLSLSLGDGESDSG
jgi:PAS domain S-box-containing protein